MVLQREQQSVWVSVCVCVCVCVCICVCLPVWVWVDESVWVCVRAHDQGTYRGVQRGHPGVPGGLCVCLLVWMWVDESVWVCVRGHDHGTYRGVQGGHPGVSGGPRMDRNLIISMIGIWYPRRSGKGRGIVATINNTQFNFYDSKYLPANMCKWDRVRSVLLKNTERN